MYEILLVSLTFFLTSQSKGIGILSHISDFDVAHKYQNKLEYFKKYVPFKGYMFVLKSGARLVRQMQPTPDPSISIC